MDNGGESLNLQEVKAFGKATTLNAKKTPSMLNIARGTKDPEIDSVT